MSDRVVLLTGASGLVGTWLRKTAPAGVDLVSLTHRTALPGANSVSADLRDGQAIGAVFGDVRPSLVIHGAMAVDAASIIGATRNVADGASSVGADLVYLSTDAVFSGDGRPVDENTLPDPVWDYGRWKAEAEQLVLRGVVGWAVVRLPLVISLDPEDRAVQRIRDGARQRQPTTWFHDEIRQPAMASDIAGALWQLGSLEPEGRSGIWQLPGPESLSRYEIARRVVDAMKLDPTSIISVAAPTGVSRPREINMLGARARHKINWHPAQVLT